MLTIPRWRFTSQYSLTRNPLPPRLRRDYLISFGPKLGQSFYLKSSRVVSDFDISLLLYFALARLITREGCLTMLVGRI